jgi:hypothetical protein
MSLIFNANEWMHVCKKWRELEGKEEKYGHKTTSGSSSRMDPPGVPKRIQL